MTEPILDPAYWKQRMETAVHEHHAIFRCPLDRWLRIEAKHREILARTIRPSDRVLDVGCAWGRLLTLMPDGWFGDYLGVDLSPDFVERARLQYSKPPGRVFLVHAVNEALVERIKHVYGGQVFDCAVLISFRPMVRRNLGDAAWDTMEEQIRRVARKLIFLEYDEADEGCVE